MLKYYQFKPTITIRLLEHTCLSVDSFYPQFFLSLFFSAQAEDLETRGQKAVKDFWTLKQVNFDEEFQTKFKNILERNALPIERPKHCPLDGGEALTKVVAALDSMRALFEDKCLKEEKGHLGALAEQSKNFRLEMNKVLEDRGEGPLLGGLDQNNDSQLTIPATSIDAAALTRTLGNVNRAINRNACDDNVRRTWLGTSADVIQNFSQLGLYTDDIRGVYFAISGMALSGFLTFIDNLFTNKFDFGNPEDRKSFAKLNCSYFNIRNQLLDQGYFQSANQVTINDYQTVKSLVPQAEAAIEKAKKEQQRILSEVDDLNNFKIKEEYNDTARFIKSLTRTFIRIESTATGPDQEKKDQNIRDALWRLVQKKEVQRLFKTIKGNPSYLVPELEHASGEEKDRLMEVEYYVMANTFEGFIDPYTSHQLGDTLKNRDFSAFNEGLRAVMKELKMVEKNIETIRTNAKKINGVNISFKIRGYDEPFDGIQFREKVVSLSENGSIKYMEKDLADLKKIELRLEKIGENPDFSTRDKSSQKAEVNDLMKKIDELIFGKVGHDYIDYIATKANKSRKTFHKKFDSFAKKYFVNHDDILKIDFSKKALTSWINPYSLFPQR